VIHVAGTNGKGSTVAYLRAMAEAAGLKVHVFTSPHLVRFAERIRLAGTLITDEHLAEVLDRVEAANAGLPITFFEITTAAAFQAFSEVPADLCLVEVGLGGILDATNVVMPAVSVIAPIDIDHREFLGDTLAAIAQEKAGIIKPNAPVVSARQQEEAERVVEREADLFEAPLTLMGRDFDAWNERGRLLVQMQDRLLDLPPRPCPASTSSPTPAWPSRPADPGRSAHRRGRHRQGDRRHDLAGPVPAPDRRPAGRARQGGRRRPLAGRRPQSPRRPSPTRG
jgi:dihydrofolate synthase/folylpolyglutamate synthase